MTSLVFVPLVAATLLYLSMRLVAVHSGQASPVPSHWIVQPLQLASLSTQPSSSTLQALVTARMGLVHLSTLCSFVLFGHMSASRLSRWWTGATSTSNRIPVDWKSLGEGYRAWIYTRFSVGLVLFCIGGRLVGAGVGLEPWSGMGHRSRYSYCRLTERSRSLVL